MRFVIGLIIVVLSSHALSAQTSSAPPAFEVASIKPSAPKVTATILKVIASMQIQKWADSVPGLDGAFLNESR